LIPTPITNTHVYCRRINSKKLIECGYCSIDEEFKNEKNAMELINEKYSIETVHKIFNKRKPKPKV
jgi:hypothetical protein